MKDYRSSPSQVNTRETCLRKWAFDKIDGIRAPPNAYAAFGTRTHKILEVWFKDGTPPPNTAEGKVARNILKHLPPPQTPGILVERHIDLVLGGVPMIGYVDLSIFEGLDRPFISDHKTTGGLQWALDAETMHDDVQVSTYGYEAMVRTNKRAIDAQWTYGTRDGKKSLPVVRNADSKFGPITLEQITPRLEKTAQAVDEMRMIFERQIPALELPYDAAGCEAYGGCPYQEHCNLTPRERIQSIMNQKETESAFLSKLRGKKGKSNGAAGAATHPPPAATAGATEVAPPVPTNSGTVNPPSAPATAPASPPAEEKPKKKRQSRRKKKDEPAAAQSAPEAPPAETPASAAPAPKPAAQAAPAAASGNMVPMADVRQMVELLVAEYRRGFADGYKLARGES